jgi:serine/threonine protein kinase
VKLADFGLSKRVTDGTAFHTKAGTQSYMAPEILNYLNMEGFEENYTNSVDIWAMGCIAYRLLVGVVPFPQGKSLVKYCEDMSLFPQAGLLDNNVKREGYQFLRQLLSSHPSQRPTASQALKHPWIASGKSESGSGFDGIRSNS